MASKRTSDGDTDLRPPRSKRHRTSRTDITSSQRGAFGDLGNATTTAPTGESDLECEDDSEALAYLRSVRTQASSIPHVLVVKKAGPCLPPRVTSTSSRPEDGADDEDGEEGEVEVERSIYENGVGDFRGYYQDGAYVAYPDNYWDETDGGGKFYDEDYEDGEHGNAGTGEADDSESSKSTESRPHNSSSDEIRETYFASIMNRYLALRKLLQASPPERAIRALPASNSPNVEEWTRGSGTFDQWAARLRGTDPLPAQIAAMHKDSVFRLLHIILTSKFLRKRAQIRERTSRWIWALLARLPDMGELDYAQVGCIRELGKRAVLLVVSLAEVELLREHCEVPGSSPDDQDGHEVGVDIDERFEDDNSQDGPGDDVDAPTWGTEASGHTTDALADKTTVTNNHDDKPSADIGDDAPITQISDNASDMEMQLDSDIEDGEIADDEPNPPPRSDPAADIAAAKAQLLSQLNNISSTETEHEDSISAGPLASAAAADKAGEETAHPSDAGVTEQEQSGEYDTDQSEGYVDERRDYALDRTTTNERVTLNMILTIAGEFYGQRDLLEFRDPFGGLQFE